MINERGTLGRTLTQHAARGWPARKAWGYVEAGRLHVGIASGHRTRSGRLYNGLMRIWRRSHIVGVE